MHLYEPFALVALGVFAGAYGMIIGAGGGFILVPLLILVWGLEPRVAVGTSLAAVVITALSGAQGYARGRLIDYRSGVLFGLAGIPGAVLGAVAVAKAPGGIVQLSMGALLLAIATYMALGPRVGAPASTGLAAGVARPGHSSRTVVTANGEEHVYAFHEPWAVAVNAVLGVAASFFGIGGGLMRTPILIYFFSFPVRIAVATSVFTMILTSGAGVVSHAVLGNISPLVLLFAGIGVVVGAQLGVGIGARLRQGVVIRLLAGGLGITGVWLILKGTGLV